MKLLLVDGSNIVMRCAFGGDVVPASSVPMAIGMIERIATDLNVTHLIVALDSDKPSFRREIYPAYKAGRTVDTSPWILELCHQCVERRWWCEDAPGFEADDIIATLAVRARERGEVLILSNDSDLLQLVSLSGLYPGAGVRVVRPLGGRETKVFDAAAVMEHYGVPPWLMNDFKAMVGERSDNIPGVDGIGKKRAAELLQQYGSLEAIIAAGSGSACKWSRRVADHEGEARLSRVLVQLRTDVPIAPIPPARCALAQEPAYA